MDSSPIDQRLWKYMFHTVAGVTIVGVAISLYRQQRHSLNTLNAFFAGIKPQDHEVTYKNVKAILDKVSEDVRAKRGCSKLEVYRNTQAIVSLLKYSEANVDIIDLLLKLILRVYASDADGRNVFHQYGGYRAVMSVLSEAHKHGHRSLMQDAATTLHSLTAVDDAEVVLLADVPRGSEGTYALSQFPATSKMLRTLDPNAPIIFLNAVTGIFANITGLHAGAKAVSKGTNNQSGASYFLALLDHGNQGIIEHSVTTLRYLIRAGEAHEEISVGENVTRLASILDVNKDPKIINVILTIILLMTSSAQRSTFFHGLEKTDALAALFTIWCKGVDKTIRDRAEVLVHLLEKVPECSLKIRRLLDQNRSNILERKSRDEEARRKQMQQMKQQQMMQQMMMQEMAGGGGGGMDMASMMGGGEEE